ncbi:MAG: hypothetical protein HYS61_09155 [Acidobacteria bacterium]|nr:hypothetical protein [Acidobacteriota bacterium]
MRSVLAACALALSLGSASSARAQLPSIPDTLSPDGMKAHLQYQWRLLLLTSILNAREHGQSATEFGTAIGRWYAQRWGPNLQPQAFGRAVEIRFRRLGFTTQVREDADSVFTFSWTGPDAVAFTRTYGSWGITVADLRDWANALNIVICDEGGLVWSHRQEGTWQVARITKRP